MLAWFVYEKTGLAITGLFSKEYMDQGWSFAKFIDLLKHIWLPVVIVGVAGTAGMIRVLRATLLDELRKQYIITKAVLIVYENTPSPRNRLMRADFNLAIRLGMFSLTRK